jgi:hypothetical protein
MRNCVSEIRGRLRVGVTLEKNVPKEKRAACDGKRPKSREETPKEGSDSARRYRTATICDRAAQSARVFHAFPMQNSQGVHACNTWVSRRIHYIFHLVNEWAGSTLTRNSDNLSFS